MTQVRWVGGTDQFINGHPAADHDSDEADMLVATGLYVLADGAKHDPADSKPTGDTVERKGRRPEPVPDAE